MYWSDENRFGAGRAPQWRGAVILMAISAAVMVGGPCGCESARERGVKMMADAGNENLTRLPTAELKARRMLVLEQYAEIQREVELKAGLPMGVAIKDERSLLGDLYREAHEIERELVRRWTRGDPEVSMEQVKANF